MRDQKEVDRRVKILGFWEEHGGKATKDAFGVSRRTLYRWSKALRDGEGKLPSLDPKSTAPKNRRKRMYDHQYVEKVLALRRVHRKLGKKKLAVLLGVSESYAGRTILDLKKRGLLPAYARITTTKTGRLRVNVQKKRKKLRRPKEAKRGIEIDTVVRFSVAVKRYIYTAIDLERRFAFAGAYESHSSKSAADFLQKLRTVAPFEIKSLQTDNGSEFAKYFSDACRALHIVQYHTYPRTPRMNAHIERFNRTISEDFIEERRLLLVTDIDRFNEEMIDWLIWYNTERPHESLGMLSPLQYIVKSLPARECQMYWTRTKACVVVPRSVIFVSERKV
ncbi:MAG: integrase core domain-containing protein [bacterium]|nr:integrase core domain-containing protein [bacterium]